MFWELYFSKFKNLENTEIDWFQVIIGWANELKSGLRFGMKVNHRIFLWWVWSHDHFLKVMFFKLGCF